MFIEESQRKDIKPLSIETYAHIAELEAEVIMSKSAQDKSNEALSVACGIIVAVMVVFVVVTGSLISIILDQMGV